MPYNKRQNNTRKNINKKLRKTLKNTNKYSEGFIRRMSEPIKLVPLKLTNEQLIRINKMMPPTLSRDQEDELFIQMNS